MNNDLLGFKSAIMEELDEIHSELSQLEEVLERIEDLKNTSAALEAMLSKIKSYESSQPSKVQQGVISQKTTATSVVRSLFDTHPEKAWLPKELKSIVRTKIENGEITSAGKTMNRNLVDNILIRLKDSGFIDKRYFDSEKKQSYYVKST